jgi:hypothetical protein
VAALTSVITASATGARGAHAERDAEYEQGRRDAGEQCGVATRLRERVG